MKKLLLLLLAFVMVVSTFSLVACKNGDRYELTNVYGLNISVEDFEYNYIDFNFNNNTYTLKNKAKATGIKCKQTGTFTEDMFGGITITNNEIASRDYFLYYNETLLFSADRETFYVYANIEGIEVIMIYSKK